MNRATTGGLIVCLIVLLVYIAVTSISLMRDLNSTGYSAAATAQPAAAYREAPEAEPQGNYNRADIGLAQARPNRKRRIKPISHRVHSGRNRQQEPITMYL